MKRLLVLALLAFSLPAQALYKNVAGQRVCLYAWNSSTNAPQTGDAANISAFRSLDGAAPAAGSLGAVTELNATNAPGSYCVTVAAADSNADHVSFTATSSTANVSLHPVQIYTNPWDNTGKGAGPWSTADVSALALEATVATRATQASVDAGFTAGAKDATVAKDNTVAKETTSQTILSTGGPGPWTTGGAGVSVAPLLTGTARAGTANTIQLAAAPSLVVDQAKNQSIQIIAGTGAGTCSYIISNTAGPDNTATVVPNFPIVPDATSQYQTTSGTCTDLASPSDILNEPVDGAISLGCAVANSHAVASGAYTQNVSGNDVTRTYNNPTNTSPRVTATFNNVSGTRGIATLNCP